MKNPQLISIEVGGTPKPLKQGTLAPGRRCYSPWRWD